jgi:Cu/Ag efflux protein CusF
MWSSMAHSQNSTQNSNQSSAASTSTAALEWVNAEITRLQLDRNRVTLKHERIASIKMDAMTMPFKLKDKALLDGYKVGDKLQVVVKNEDGDLFITQVRKQP